MGLFDKLKKKEITAGGKILAAASGECVKLEKVPDEVFAQKMLGDGAAIIPSSGTVCVPVSGIVSEVFDTLHAYGITSDDGLEILVHIGINTVELNGEGFQALVKKGQKVKAGQPLANVELDLIKSKGYEIYTPVIITNMEEAASLSISEGAVTAGETVIITYQKNI